MADFSIGVSEASPNSSLSADDSVTVLHLSDLQLGEGSREDVDWKVWLEAADTSDRVNRLRNYLRALPRSPDYVVISGDLTILGRIGGFREFKEMVLELIREQVFPSSDPIIMVPGNHDVTRKIGDRFAVGEERCQAFRDEVGEQYVRPWLPGDQLRPEIESHLRAC